MKFSKKVKVNNKFQRSVQITTDMQDFDVVNGFVCPESCKNLLSQMSLEILSGQCAFTWTGSYGSGKSSLAILLNALLSPNDKDLYDIATKKIGQKLTKDIHKAFTQGNNGRIVVPVLGRPEDVRETLIQALTADCPELSDESSSEDIIQSLQQLSKKKDGVLLIVDEMGKFLDGAARNNADVYLFQQLAETANRSEGRIIIIGILHQSFNEYSRSLTAKLRDEWRKIQGRYTDLAVNVAGEEQLMLIEKTIKAPKTEVTAKISTSVSKTIAYNKNIDESSVGKTLKNTFPLHPITSCLIGPISKRRFGQNQRSLFAFLTSAEVGGFKDFINNNDYDEKTLFSPDRLYDYLRFNLEPSIMVSPDSSQWISGGNAIKRCDANGGDLHHMNILKAIILLNMFVEQSGINAKKDILLTLLPKNDLDKVLKDLMQWSIVIYKKHQNSFSIYEGSDFDIDGALGEARSKITDIDLAEISSIANLRPVLAKRHYHETGSMRWFDVKIGLSDDLENVFKAPLSKGASGCMFVILDINQKANISQIQKQIKELPHPVIFTLAEQTEDIIEYGTELQTYKWILDHKVELSGDKVARNEINERISNLRHIVENTITDSIHNVSWHTQSKTFHEITQRGLNSLLSDICSNDLYPYSLRLKSELVNREKPSASANTALNKLIKTMIIEDGEPHLALEGFSAEMGLYKIFLEKTGLYCDIGEDFWEFSEPQDNQYGLKNLWSITDAFLKKRSGTTTVEDIFHLWNKPPYGVKQGLSILLLVAYLKTREDSVVTYLETIYRPSIDDLFIDILLKNPKKTAVQWVEVTDQKSDFLQAVNVAVKNVVPTANVGSPLDTAREIVRLFDSLNQWITRTKLLSEKSIKLREIIKKANDPNKLLFVDIVDIFGEGKNSIDEFEKSLFELVNFYPEKMIDIGKLLVEELQIGLLTPKTVKGLKQRADKVYQQEPDLHTKAFASRLKEIEMDSEGGIPVSVLEGISGLAGVGNTSEWIDLDFSRVKREITVLCNDFKKAELYTYIDSERDASRTAVTLMIGSGKNTQIYQSDFVSNESDIQMKQDLKKNLKELIDDLNADNKQHLVLFLMTEILEEYMDKEKQGNG